MKIKRFENINSFDWQKDFLSISDIFLELEGYDDVLSVDITCGVRDGLNSFHGYCRIVNGEIESINGDNSIRDKLISNLNNNITSKTDIINSGSFYISISINIDRKSRLSPFSNFHGRDIYQVDFYNDDIKILIDIVDYYKKSSQRIPDIYKHNISMLRGGNIEIKLLKI